MSTKKNSWFKDNYNYFVDFALLVLSIALTIFIMIITSDKFKSIEFVNRHPTLIILTDIFLLLVSAIIKLCYEIQQKNIKQKIVGIKEENNFLNELIKRFKYQICGHLESVLFNSLKEFQLHEDTKYRVTVYTYTKGRFFSIGRFSHSPSYKNFGRIAIRDQSELLFKSWNHGELIETVIPCEKRNMKSIKIAIRYLYETKDKKDKFGVIVYETTKKNDTKLKNGNLEKMTLNINQYFFEKMNIRQDLNFAMDEGL